MNQQGRSMVEMLGVLAIIGVLSIGAIAGYSKAMMKYKLNKQAEQISTLINIGLRYSKQWNFSENTEMVPYFIKLNEIPKEMIKENSSRFVYDVFNIEIRMLYSINGSKRYTQLFLQLDTSKNDDYGLSICRNLLNAIKEFHVHLKSLEVLSKEENGGWYGAICHGDNYCTASKVCLKDITVGQIDELCRYNFGKTDTPHLKIVWDE